jgi:hypothetical protein
MMRKLYLVLPLLALLPACATLNNITTTQTVLINQLMTLGAELYIQKAGGTAVPPALYSTAQQARAQSVYNDAAEIAGFATGTITVTQLDASLNKWVAAGKTPLDQTLREALVTEVNVLLATKVSTGVLNAAATALVTEIAADFEAAAVAYGAKAGA